MTQILDLAPWPPLGYTALAKRGTCPPGWLPADGSTYFTAEYPELATELEIPAWAITFTMRDPRGETVAERTDTYIIVKARI